MRTLIFGAGAIGSYLGGLLAGNGADVTLLARGAQYRALTDHGIQFEWADGRSKQVGVKTCEPGAAGSSYDLVICTLKSMQLAGAADEMMAALAPDGALVMIQNGLPWWYFDQVDSPWRGRQLASLDADGTLAKKIALDRVVGAVIYKPVTGKAPGHLFLPKTELDSLILGELDNRLSERTQRIATFLTAACMPTEVTADIRAAKWGKLLLNVLWNPLCTLTQSAPGRIAATAGGAELVRQLSRESAAVAASIGVVSELEVEAELRRVAGNFAQTPSMLQDLRAGRPLEWDAILNVIIEIAGLTGVAVPALRNVAACIGLLDQRVRTEGVAICPVSVKAAAAAS